MTITKEAREARNNNINKLVSEGLGCAEIAERLNISLSTVRRDMLKFGLKKPKFKNQSWKDIHEEACNDYLSGMTVREMAEKYNRTEKSVVNFVNRYGCKRNIYLIKNLENSRRKTDSERYINELNGIKRNVKVGDMVKYRGAEYTVETKYDTFVVLRGKNYRTSMMYDDFVRREKDGSVIYG